MWSFKCPGDSAPYGADAALPGIVEEFTDPESNGVQGFHVVQLFDIAEGADMASILPAVRAASPAPGKEECLFAPAGLASGKLELRPTGALTAKYQLFLDQKVDEPSPPRGQLGPSERRARYFFRLPGSAAKAAVAFMPSDLAIFDPETIKATE